MTFNGHLYGRIPFFFFLYTLHGGSTVEGVTTIEPFDHEHHVQHCSGSSTNSSSHLQIVKHMPHRFKCPIYLLWFIFVWLYLGKKSFNRLCKESTCTIFMFWLTTSELVGKRQRLQCDALFLFPTKKEKGKKKTSSHSCPILLSDSNYLMICARFLFGSSSVFAFWLIRSPHTLHSDITLFTSEMFCVHIF